MSDSILTRARTMSTDALTQLLPADPLGHARTECTVLSCSTWLSSVGGRHACQCPRVDTFGDPTELRAGLPTLLLRVIQPICSRLKNALPCQSGSGLPCHTDHHSDPIWRRFPSAVPPFPVRKRVLSRQRVHSTPGWHAATALCRRADGGRAGVSPGLAEPPRQGQGPPCQGSTGGATGGHRRTGGLQQ